ncbi:SRR1-like protein isoform X2 [Thamnophis elegans]|uniref:SRR1-like protein isoform X2 n=1 Tax=Thamnophis elegans TaxID=35005 RepID=UPI00137696CE|nr:SRR1-like protein isoform X2 [Thamnophis elegans]
MSVDGGRAGGARRRRRRRRGAAEDERPEAAGERQRRRLQEALSELKDSDFWDCSRRTILRALRSPPAAQQETPRGEAALGAPGGRGAGGLRCVCYGLGSFCSCGKARLQLAFLLLLLEELKVEPVGWGAVGGGKGQGRPWGQSTPPPPAVALQIAPESCFVFDPAFSTLETELLGGLGLTVLQRNEEGKRSIEGPTLFYMIHCGKALYNNLLWSNWSAEALSQMVVVGNSFRGFEERLLAKVFWENYSYIAKVLEATQEEALPPHLQHPDVFNDTSVHCFPLQRLRGLPQDCWACWTEPRYSEDAQLEIIRNKPQ